MKKRTKRRALLGISVLCLIALFAASCGDDDDEPAATTTTAASNNMDDGSDGDDMDDGSDDASMDDAMVSMDDMDSGGTKPSIGELKNTDLSGICPNPLVIQTDWFPEPEHGHTYNLVGIDGEIDTTNGKYTGPLYNTGIDVEIRAGGPYINNASPSQQFYADPDIFMAYVNTSDALKFYKNSPTVAVLTNFEVGPQILMWDPEVYDFDTFEDIGDSGATVLYFGGANYMDLLLAQGVIDPANADDSYNGSPGRFIAEGNLVQQGFATSEPYRYENDFEDWLKPVAFKLIHESGHEIYQSSVSVKPTALTQYRECLEKLVPIMQADIVEYMNDPDDLNVRLDEIVKALDSFWQSSIPAHNWATQQMKDLGLVTDGDNGMVGDMDGDRIQRFIDLMSPIHNDNGVAGFEDGADIPSANDLFTNEFLYSDISLGY